MDSKNFLYNQGITGGFRGFYVNFDDLKKDPSESARMLKKLWDEAFPTIQNVDYKIPIITGTPGKKT